MTKIRIKKKAILFLPLFFVFFVFILVTLLGIYFILPNSNDSTLKNIIIENGYTSSDVAKLLKNEDLIKNENVFKLALKIKKVDNIYAASYYFSKDMNLFEIIDVIASGGHNENEIIITFKEGINMRQIAKIIEESTNNNKDDVFTFLKDEKSIDDLIEKYWFLTDEIKNENIYYSLEGYLFPDTYFFVSKDVTVKEIFETLLDEMDKVLTPYKEKFTKSKYNVHEILTLASLVELEGVSEKDRKNIASVFYNRLDENMSLGSDVTTYYAVKLDLNERDLTQYELDSYNPYNTRGPKMEGKLPVGPIAMSSLSSIEAALEPNNTNYLYFVADKNRNVYFTKTFSEHEKMINKLQNEGLWYEW